MLSTQGLLNIFDINTSRRNVIELLFSTLIILILITLSMPIYSDCRLKAKITHFSGELDTKRNMYTFHAVNGTWPVNKKQLNEFEKEMGFSIFHSKNASTMDKSDFIEKTDLKNGVLNILFKGYLEGQILSLRPAVPKMDKTGPIILVCGKNKPGWLIAGKDETTIDDRLLTRFLR